MQRMKAAVAPASLLIVLASWSAAEAQQGPDAATQGAASAAQTRNFGGDARLNLSAAQKRTIYQSITDAKTSRLPQGTPVIVGTMVPMTVVLRDLPDNVTRQVKSAAEYKYVKLRDRKLLLVEPTSRVVAGIITGREGSLGAPTPATGSVPRDR